MCLIVYGPRLMSVVFVLCVVIAVAATFGLIRYLLWILVCPVVYMSIRDHVGGWGGSTLSDATVMSHTNRRSDWAEGDWTSSVKTDISCACGVGVGCMWYR